MPDAGYHPLSLLCERRHIEGDAVGIIRRCGSNLPVYTANSFSESMGRSSHVHGTRNTEPIDTLTDRRFSGSQEVGVSSTPSMPSAAADLNMAPMLVVSVTPSITTMRRELRHTSSADKKGLILKTAFS